MVKSGGEGLMAFFRALLDHYGQQNWWPGDGCFEVMAGAILTQNTNWSNVEKALDNLKTAGLLDAEKIDKLNQESLAQLIRPAGYYNIKARRLKNFVRWFCQEYDGSVERLAELSVERLREELLSVKGIGRETADSIILYGLEKLTFVVDSYTYRVLGRHGCIDPESDYAQIKEYCESQLPDDIYVYNELHALLVQVGKHHCRPRPRCAGCPLEIFDHSIEM